MGRSLSIKFTESELRTLALVLGLRFTRTSSGSVYLSGPVADLRRAELAIHVVHRVFPRRCLVDERPTAPAPAPYIMIHSSTIGTAYTTRRPRQARR